MRVARAVAVSCLLLNFGGQVTAQALIKKAGPGPVPAGKAPAAVPAGPAANGVAASDEQVLKAANLAPTAAALLDFFRKRAAAEASPEKLKELINRLGDSSGRMGGPGLEGSAAAGPPRGSPGHTAAFAELVSLGAVAIPALRQAANNLDDLEVAGRARQCLLLVEGSAGANLSRAAARLLGQQKPAGAAEVLLQYLPFAEDDEVVREIEEVLAAVGLQNGKPDAALVRALEDTVPIRRAVAAETICTLGSGPAAWQPELLALVRPLLKDAKPTVRLRTALGLANANDSAAIPVLIDLLTELAPAQRQQAEAYLIDLAGDWAVTAPEGDSEVMRRLRREVWAAWWKATDGPALLQEFRRRTLSDADRERALGLIEKLGDGDLQTRERASAELLALGTAVAPLLHQAAQGGRANIGPEAKRSLQLLEKDKPSTLPTAALRLVALHRPPGAADALWAYLPNALGEDATDEFRAALAAVAFRDGKAEPAVVKALSDKLAVRRAAAAEALCAGGLNDHQQAVRRLLKDSDATVRLRTALALARAQDKEAIPVLIALLADLPPGEVWQAQECLVLLAGDKAPNVAAGSDPDSRQKCRDAWLAWWKENGAKVQLAALTKGVGRQRYYGYTLLVMNNNGMVMELGADGKERWQLTGLMNPMDAQVLPGDRVLVAEYNGNRVTERNLKNEILWQKAINWPVSCERLPGGNTVLVSRQQVIEVTRDGKEVFTLNRANFNDIMAARKLRDGHIVVVSSMGTCMHFDARGKELKNFRFPHPVQIHGIDILPNGNVLIPVPWQANKIYEYNTEGKVVWEVAMAQAWTASRSPNGNTMVAVQMWPAKVFELDKNGKTVWEHVAPQYVMRVKRR